MRLKLLVIVFVITAIALFFLLKFFFRNKVTEGIDCKKEFKYPLFRLICQAYKEKNIERCNYFKHAYKELCAKAALVRINVNKTFCNSFKDKAYRDVCFMTLAIKTKDYRYCPNDCCKFIIGSPEACKSISDKILKAECFAKVYRDKRYCLNIPDEDIKKECICWSGNGNKEDCKRFVFENLKPEECGKNPLCVSFNVKNLKECSKFLDEEESELCKLFYLTKIFYESGNLCIYTENYLLWGS